MVFNEVQICKLSKHIVYVKQKRQTRAHHKLVIGVIEYNFCVHKEKCLSDGFYVSNTTS